MVMVRGHETYKIDLLMYAVVVNTVQFDNCSELLVFQYFKRVKPFTELLFVGVPTFVRKAMHAEEFVRN